MDANFFFQSSSSWLQLPFCTCNEISLHDESAPQKAQACTALTFVCPNNQAPINAWQVEWVEGIGPSESISITLHMPFFLASLFPAY
jgi:hypothetical protein